MTGDEDLIQSGWRETRRTINGSTRSLTRYRRTRGEPARIEPPTLILWAEDDRFLESHLAEAGLALCDDGRLEFVEGASHWLTLSGRNTSTRGSSRFSDRMDSAAPLGQERTHRRVRALSVGEHPARRRWRAC